MQRETFRELIRKFAQGNTSPQVAIHLEIDIGEFTEVLKAFRKVEYVEHKTQSIERAVVEQMIADGMKKERFLQITSYKASTYEKKAREDNVPVGKSGLLSEICEEFGLKPDVAIKEQWF